MTTTTQIRSLKTPDVSSGVALSTELARDIARSMEATRQSTAKPGGMNYGEPAPMSPDAIAGIILVAVSIANDGWSK